MPPTPHAPAPHASTLLRTPTPHTPTPRAHHAHAPPTPRWCVVLTATVHVNVDLRQHAWGHEQQRNAWERRAMYTRVLRHWFTHLPGVPITIVENSGDSLEWALGAARQLNRSRDLAVVRLGSYAHECRHSIRNA